MKPITLKVIPLLLFSVLVSSCTNLLYTSLDVLRPAKVTFSPDIKNILVVNNSVKQPSDYGHKNELINEKVKNITLNTDSLAIFCLGALTEELNQKEFFSSVVLNTNSLNKSRDFFTIQNLSPDLTKALCTQYSADAVLSLDKIKVNDIIKEFYLEEENNSYLSYLEARYETHWSIYTPNESTFSSKIFKDTVYWESKSNQRRKATASLPNRSDALIDGALYVGQHTVGRFIPYWEKVDRYFYNTGNKHIKQGIDSVYVKNWNSAIKHWQTAISKSINNSTKAKAASNIAVAYEIIGDIENALNYATTSLRFYEKTTTLDFNRYMLILDYVKELKRRKEEISLLKKQLGT